MPHHYDETFKKKIVRLRIEEGRSVKSIIEEYGISKSSVIKWCNNFAKNARTALKAKMNTIL